MNRKGKQEGKRDREIYKGIGIEREEGREREGDIERGG